MILNRSEFADHFNQLQAGLGDSDSPLWIAEHDTTACQQFVCVRPLPVQDFRADYYKWCAVNLEGTVHCFSSDTDNQQEWWGFTDSQDMVIWLLKWA